MKLTFLLLLAAVSAVPGRAQGLPGFALEIAVEDPTEEVPIQAAIGLAPNPVRPGELVDVAVRIRVAAGWHIYDLDTAAPYRDTELSLELPAGLEPVGSWLHSPSRADPLEPGLRVWSDEAVFLHRARVASAPAAGSEIACTLSYQACNADFCLPPAEIELSVACGGTDDEAAWAPHRATRVLYAGVEGGQREAVFGEFLSEWFDQSATQPLESLSMETARDYDVVIVDWMSQYENDGYPERNGGLHRAPVVLGPEFTKPFIAMTYVGTQVRQEYKLDWL